VVREKMKYQKKTVVLVGSKNPVKINATLEAFNHYFENVEVIGVSVDSGVPDQPVNEQTPIGAKNRALALRKMSNKEYPEAHYFVGIEGGICELYTTWFSYGSMYIVDKEGTFGWGTSPLFQLPRGVISELLKGYELGTVMDKLTGDHNTKQKSGTVGILTKGIIDRKNLYVSGLVAALIPFVNKNLFF
jgi:inosine/xanthosine triphosphatase